jgi:hypothetical protein
MTARFCTRVKSRTLRMDLEKVPALDRDTFSPRPSTQSLNPAGGMMRALALPS